MNRDWDLKRITNYELRITNLIGRGFEPPPILELRIDELRIDRIHPLLFTSFTDAWRFAGLTELHSKNQKGASATKTAKF